MDHAKLCAVLALAKLPLYNWIIGNTVKAHCFFVHFTVKVKCAIVGDRRFVRKKKKKNGDIK